MDHHLDIVLRPDPEFPAHQLMSALYAKLHRALVKLGATHIGVSFPDVDARAPTLGGRLRLHGQLDDLATLMQLDWLTGMRDHASVGTPLPVPADAPHRHLRRVQAKSSPARLRRRLMRRHDIDEATATQRIPDEAAELLQLPFIQLASASTDQTFRIFISHEAIQQQAVDGEFNTYGLSQRATVPWF